MKVSQPVPQSEIEDYEANFFPAASNSTRDMPHSSLSGRRVGSPHIALRLEPLEKSVCHYSFFLPSYTKTSCIYTAHRARNTRFLGLRVAQIVYFQSHPNFQVTTVRDAFPILLFSTGHLYFRTLAHGAGTLLKSLTNPNLPPNQQLSSKICPRDMSVHDWAKIVQAFIKWPFRPQVCLPPLARGRGY